MQHGTQRGTTACGAVGWGPNQWAPVRSPQEGGLRYPSPFSSSATLTPSFCVLLTAASIQTTRSFQSGSRTYGYFRKNQGTLPQLPSSNGIFDVKDYGAGIEKAVMIALDPSESASQLGTGISEPQADGLALTALAMISITRFDQQDNVVSGTVIWGRAARRSVGRLRTVAETGNRNGPSGHAQFFWFFELRTVLRRPPKLPANRRRLPSNRRRLPSNRRRLPSNRRRVPSNRRRVPSNRRRLPSNRRRLPSNRRRLPSNRRRLPSNRRRLPSNRRRLLSNRPPSKLQFCGTCAAGLRVNDGLC